MAHKYTNISDLSVLIVGLGSIGSRHYSNLRALGLTKLGILRTSNTKPHTPLDLANIPVYDDYAKALANNYDAVLICNPTSMHLKYALTAARNRCNVFIEKPLSNNMNQVYDIEQLVDKFNLKVGLGYQMKFHPNLLDIKTWISEKRIGKLVNVTVNAGEYLPLWHPWENHETSYAARKELGGGVALTQIHDIDYLTWIFGDLELLYAYGGNSGILGTDVEDYVTATLKTDTNTTVHLHLDYLQNPPARTMKIVGQYGTIDWDYYQNIANLTISGKIEQISNVEASWERNTMFLDEIKDFLYAIINDNEPTSNIPNTLSGLKTTLAIMEYINSN
ncbi:MAG: hypothetical protein CL743_01790 [Chloroflexi bacterium]|nr:hypothetical protein [Chloroflexota bacterium]|tara:strand:- start:22060 stop:23061 length:1002 start_codon:yes stop_codon:yes gene_type:complete